MHAPSVARSRVANKVRAGAREERTESNGLLEGFTRKAMDLNASGICIGKELLLEGASHPGLIAVG
jgi:hypothetical protein